MFEQLHRRFVDLVEGLYVAEVTQREKVMLSSYKSKTKKPAKPKAEKGDTLKITLDLITQGKTLEEIVQERGLATSTILSHIFNIHLLYPDINLKKFKPEKELLDVVKSAIKKAENQGDTDENGRADLKSVYAITKGTVSYVQIKRCMMFL